MEESIAKLCKAGTTISSWFQMLRGLASLIFQVHGREETCQGADHCHCHVLPPKTCIFLHTSVDVCKCAVIILA